VVATAPPRDLVVQALDLSLSQWDGNDWRLTEPSVPNESAV
jgi:hypothetical protein